MEIVKISKLNQTQIITMGQFNNTVLRSGGGFDVVARPESEVRAAKAVQGYTQECKSMVTKSQRVWRRSTRAAAPRWIPSKHDFG